MGRSPGFAQRVLEVASLARPRADGVPHGRARAVMATTTGRRAAASIGGGADGEGAPRAVASRRGELLRGRARARSDVLLALGSLALGLGLALAGPGVAEAEPELRWEAPAGCPDEVALREGLGRALASVPAARRDAADLRARARVQETAPGRYALELEITAHGDVSARRVEASSCEELADAAALLIAMVIDPTAGGPAEAPAPVDEASAQPEEEEPGQPPTSEEAAPGSSPPAPPRPAAKPSAMAQSQPAGLKVPALRVGVGAELALGGAGLPGFGAGTGLNAALLREHLRVELSARYHLPRTRALAGLEETDAAVRYDLVVGGARGCGVGEVGARVGVELFGCVGVELGAMRGVGRGLPVSASYSGLWAAALLTPGLAIPVTPRLAVVARGDVGVALSRPRFAVLNYGDAFRAPAVSYALALGIELRAPAAPLRRRPKKSGTDPAARGQSPREPPSR